MVRVMGSTARRADDQAGDLLMVRLVGQFPQRLGQFLFRETVEQVGAGLLEPVVHPHVERPFMLVADAALGIVDLHARNAQVGEDDVEAVELLLR